MAELNSAEIEVEGYLNKNVQNTAIVGKDNVPTTKPPSILADTKDTVFWARQEKFQAVPCAFLSAQSAQQASKQGSQPSPF